MTPVPAGRQFNILIYQDLTLSTVCGETFIRVAVHAFEPEVPILLGCKDGFKSKLPHDGQHF